MTEKELTEFVKEAIFVLKEELSDGYLTEREYQNYVNLFHFAMDRVLENHPQMREETNRMTEPKIILPSMIWDEVNAKIADQELGLLTRKPKLPIKMPKSSGFKK